MSFIKNLIRHFFQSNTFQKGAALAYYAVFSIIPIIVIVVSIFGLLFGKASVSNEIFNQLSDTIGGQAAGQLQDLIQNQNKHHNSIITTIIGFITLMLSASGMFSQIHNAFNSIWGIKAKPKNGVLRYVTKHLASFCILLVLFLLIIISTSISAVLANIPSETEVNGTIAYLYEHMISIVLLSLAFGIMYKYLGDAIVNWKPALMGGLFTAILFTLGKIGIAYYLGKSHLSSTFGSASILALIMLWVYYTSQIIFLGASFVKLIGDKMKVPIEAAKGATLIRTIDIE